jgi:hypothetical protein
LNCFTYENWIGSDGSGEVTLAENYVYDGSSLLMVLDAFGNITHTFLNGQNGQPLADDAGSGNPTYWHDLSTSLTNIGRWGENEASQAWNWTENTVSQALQWTENEASQAWQATENAASQAWQWTENEATQAWQSTESAVSRAWQWTENKASQAWQWTQNTASQVWHSVTSSLK